MKRSMVANAAALCAVAALWPAAAGAQTNDSWQFQGILYLYLPTISGQSNFVPPGGGSGSSVGLDASTILEHLQMAFMGTLEARKGQWGGFTDLMYMNLGASKSGSRDITIGGTPLPAGASANLDYDLKGTIWTLAGTYRALSDPASTVDVFAGARMFDLSQNLNWQVSGNVASIPLPGRGGTATSDMTLWDGIVGVKGRVALGADRKWFVPYYLDVGTGQSTRTWQAMTGIGYSFGWGDVVGTWRYLDYQMKSDAPVQSMNFNGPAIAAVWRW